MRDIKFGFKYGGMEVRRIEIIDDFSIIHISTKKYKSENGIQIGVHNNGDIEIKLGDSPWVAVCFTTSRNKDLSAGKTYPRLLSGDLNARTLK